MILGVACVFLVSILVSVQSNPIGRILEYSNEVKPDGYSFSYQTDDGTRRNEQGTFTKNTNNELSYSVNGGHTFRFPDNTYIDLFFFADDTGYHPRYTIRQKLAKGDVFSSPIPSAAIASLAGGGLGK